MKRKFLALVLSVVMLLSMLPATSYATEVESDVSIVESTETPVVTEPSNEPEVPVVTAAPAEEASEVPAEPAEEPVEATSEDLPEEVPTEEETVEVTPTEEETVEVTPTEEETVEVTPSKETHAEEIPAETEGESIEASNPMSILPSDGDESDVDLDAKINVTGSIVWVHGELSTSDRPTTVNLTLMNGEEVVESKTISGSGSSSSWSFSFDSVPKYSADGKTVDYTVVQGEVDNYDTTYSADTLTITNIYVGKLVTQHNFDHIDVRIAKGASLEFTYIVRDENGNVVSKSSESIKTNVTNVHSVTINGIKYTGFSKSGNYEFRKTRGVNIPLSSLTTASTAVLLVDMVEDGGEQRTFKNVEVVMGLGGIMEAARDCDGYSSRRKDPYSGLDFNVGAVMNYSVTIEHKALSINIQKYVKPENGNATAFKGEGGEFTFELVESLNGVETDRKTVTNDANGKASFTLAFDNDDAEKTYTYVLTEKSSGSFYEANNERHTFSVKVSKVEDGSKITILPELSSNSNEFTFTNVYKTVNKTVTKEWKDGDDQDGIRPDSVKVQLYADKQMMGEPIILRKTNNWSYTWYNLNQKGSDGHDIVYTVKEVGEYEGYVTSVKGMTITNSHTPEVVPALTVTKEWKDGNNQDGIRPTSVQVQLYANGQTMGESVTLNGNTNWQYTWKNLPKFANGVEIVYTVEEVGEYEGYVTSVKGMTITNSHTPEVVPALTVTKEWKDGDNQDGIRPTSVQVQLYANGQTMGESVTLNGNTNWQYTWKNLPKFANGVEIVYTVEEVGEYEGYVTSVKGMTITNTHKPAETSVSVIKEWADGDNRDGIRPDSVQVQLYADGQTKGEPVTLNAANDWHYTWNHLPVYHDGQSIVYTYAEVNVPGGYNASVDPQKGTLTNTHKPETTAVTVEKKWDDDNDRDGVRPNSITVQLWANDEKVGNAVELTAKDGWKYTWENLFVNENGQKIKYAVTEISADGNYISSVEGLVITNTHAVFRTTKSVEKVWKDGDNQDGIRPTSITVQLQANGKDCGAPVVLNSSNNWSYTWKNLYAKENGAYIQYTLKEIAVTGYTSSCTENNGVFTLTNVHKPVTISEKSVSKIWSDADNRDGLRPESISVQLLADGKAYGDAIELSENTNWTGIWKNLPKYAGGKEIVYTFVEDVPEDYTAEYDFVNGTITNSHDPELTEITVDKVWDDNDDFDGLRPESVMVQLLTDGVACGRAVTLSEKNDWSYTWDELYVYDDGEIIHYTVEEQNIAKGYVATVEDLDDGVICLINTHEASKLSKTVSKKWDDNDDSRKKRPESIKVQLYADGKPFGEVVTLTAESGWTYTWDELSAIVDGEAVVYTVKEIDVPSGYYAKYSNDGFTITNVYDIIPKTGQDENSNRMWWLMAALSAMVIAFVLPTDRRAEKHRRR